MVSLYKQSKNETDKQIAQHNVRCTNSQTRETINFPNIEIFEDFFPEDCIALSFYTEHTSALEVSLWLFQNLILI